MTSDALPLRTLSRLKDFKSQEHTQAACVFAEDSHTTPELLEAIAKLTQGRLKHLISQNLAHAFEVIRSRLKDFSSHDTPEDASTVWAIITVGHVSPELCDAVAVVTQVGHAPSEFLDANAEITESRLLYFNSQDIAETANTVRAILEAGHISPELFDVLAVVTPFGHATPEFLDARSLWYFKSQNIAEVANTVWASVDVGHASLELFDGIAEIANTVRAIIEVGHVSPEPFDAIAVVTQVGHAPSEFLDANAEMTKSHLLYFNSQDIAETANTVWAILEAGHISPELFDVLAVVTPVGHAPPEFLDASSLQHFNSQDIAEVANTIWAIVEVGHTSLELFDGCDCGAMAIQQWHPFMRFQRRQQSLERLQVSKPGEHSMGYCNTHERFQFSKPCEHSLGHWTSSLDSH